MKSKCIMIQGTASSVGKSLITAGLCRVFKQDGHTVAPFKSQNMALNSFVTKEGKEMGRAQVVQAEAAGIEPRVEMNPILIKPSTDVNAQVIIKGEVYKNMSAVEYDCFKPTLSEMIRDIYKNLEAKNDIVVIEGAGSPAEINLRENDIVNMGMAKIADAPVILVGDIDKGGVFAALAGTMLLLTDIEKARVKGVIINKFRGDLSILNPGIKMLEEIIGIPVLGVLPYVRLEIEDEDGFQDERVVNFRKMDDVEVDIVVIKLAHMSNYTDFQALGNIAGVKVRYVEKGSELGQPDVIIIPGSKNTMGDLLSIRESGIEIRIKELNRNGVMVFGVCGGYQMLGMEITDPFGTESEVLQIEGIGLLNCKTVFQQKKITTQVEAIVCDNQGLMKGLEGSRISGYEIHMGTTEHGEGCLPFLNIEGILGEKSDGLNGVRNESGTVYGTYMHGMFDNMVFNEGFINNIRRQKGLAQLKQDGMSYKDFKETQYDNLAAILREHLDMEKIYEIVGIE